MLLSSAFSCFSEDWIAQLFITRLADLYWLEVIRVQMNIVHLPFRNLASGFCLSSGFITLFGDELTLCIMHDGLWPINFIWFVADEPEKFPEVIHSWFDLHFLRYFSLIPLAIWNGGARDRTRDVRSFVLGVIFFFRCQLRSNFGGPIFCECYSLP